MRGSTEYVNGMTSKLTYGQKQVEMRKLEKLFGLRFSRLNIDEEYEYNLLYLIRNCQIPENLYATYRMSNKYSDPNRFIKAPTRRYDSFKSKSALFLNDEKPERQSPIWKTETFHPNNHHDDAKLFCSQRTLAYSTSSLQKYRNQLPVVKPKPVFCRRSKTDDIINERCISRTPDSSATPPIFDSTYAGVHVYLGNSYNGDEISSFELSNSRQRTVACDPILIVHPHSAQKSCSKSRQLYTGGQQVKYNGIDHSNHHSRPKVASRVEALMALIDPDQQKGEHQVSSTNYGCIEREQNNGPWTEATEYCFSCCKRIYAVDRISIEDRVYHKACFKCATCQRTVLPGTFACLDGVILCKPHYIEQFRRSGRYEIRAPNHRVEKLESSVNMIEVSEG